MPNTENKDYSLIQIKLLNPQTNKMEWFSITTPSTLTYTRSDYDAEEGSYRDITGTMSRQRITTKVKLELTWKSGALDVGSMSTLLKAVDALFFDVKYFDPYEGGYTEKTMYVGDRTATMYSFVNGKPIWNNVSYNLIEK